MMAIEQLPISDLEELLRQWTAESKAVSIAVVGKTGAGKSTLINSIVGRKVRDEGKGLTAETISVEKTCQNINGVDVTFWDTPGLRDPLVVTDSDATLQKIAEKCKMVDLVLCCIPMNSARITKDDVDVLVKFTKAFGEGVWHNTIIALTFANLVTPPPESSDDIKTYFRERVSQWKEIVYRVLNGKCSVSSEIARDVSVVPAGHRKLSLPDREDWFTVLWVATFEKMKDESKPALLKINRGRLRQAEVGLDSQEMEPHERPIVLNRFDLNAILMDASPTLAKSMETWSTLGTSVSATLGTLMSFFGLEAQAGIVGQLGGPIGKGVGVAVAVVSVVYKAFSQWRAQRNSCPKLN